MLCGGRDVSGPGRDPGRIIVWRDGENGIIDEIPPFLVKRLPRTYPPEMRVIATLPDTPTSKVDRQALRQTRVAN